MTRKFNHGISEEKYQQYLHHLRSPYWYEVKRRVRLRSKGQCEAKENGVRCPKSAFAVHHTVYRNVLYRELEDNLLEKLEHLCKEHHTDRHPEHQTEYDQNLATIRGMYKSGMTEAEIMKAFRMMGK